MFKITFLANGSVIKQDTTQTLAGAMNEVELFCWDVENRSAYIELGTLWVGGRFRSTKWTCSQYLANQLPKDLIETIA